MDIKPGDLGLIVQRMAEVDRAQQVRDQRSAQAQQQFGLQMKADQERRETKVKGSPEAAKLALSPDGRRERKEREESEAQGGSREPGGSDGGAAEGTVKVPRPPGNPGERLDIKL